MTEKASDKPATSERLAGSTWLLVVIIAACLLFGLVGWQAQAEALRLTGTDVLYRTLSALWLSDTFQSSADWGCDWRIEVARWLGVAAFIIGGAKALLALLSVRWRRFVARRATGHVVVAGDTPLARAIVAWALGRGDVVHWGGAPDDAQSNRLLFADTGPFQPSTVARLAVSRARLCAIAMDQDTQAVELARRMREAGISDRRLMVNLRSPWLALHADTLDGMNGVRLFSDARVAVREAQRRHPPYLLARSHGQTKMHCAIIGLGDLGEAVLIETLLTCITTQHRRPLFTIVDPQAPRIERHLALRYPELDKSAELRFFEGSVEGDTKPLSHDALHAIGDPHPITAAYVCLSDGDAALSIGFVLKAMATRGALDVGPIHVRQSAGEALGPVAAGIGHLAPGQLIPFGGTADVIHSLGLASRDPDALARTFHEAYRKATPDDKSANVPWQDLTDDLRDSNRRVAMHIPAKLASLGVDVDAWLSASPNGRPDRWPDVPTPNAEQLEALAELEHDRWMADRRLNGWQFAQDRDNPTLRHPDLVPFAELSDESQHYDRVMVRQMLQALSQD